MTSKKAPLKKSSQFITLTMVYSHLCDRVYMSGVKRDKKRVDSTGEVFTPDSLAKSLIEQLIASGSTTFNRVDSDVLDPSCGDGQFLAWVTIYKLCDGNLEKLNKPEASTDNIYPKYLQVLSHLYGVDLMKDNVKECHKRLSCGFRGKVSEILKKNVRQANSLTYDFSFE